jgi:conjugal transfer pilus assembly protein TraF
MFFVFLLVVQGEAQDKNMSKYYGEQTGQEAKSMGYYKDDGRKGWWWYEDPVKKEEEAKRREVRKEEARKEEKKEEAKKEEVRKEEARKEEEVKPLHEYSYEELLRMPVDKFKKIYEYYEKLAVSNPTEENLYYFYNILDVARKKALLFTMQAMYVWQKYPELAEVAKDVPTVMPGVYAKREEISREVEGYLNARRGEYGLVVFVSERCPYCKAQLGILRTFIENYGWEVKVVDVDYDKRAVAVFGIETVPSIIIVSRRTGEWFPLSVGVISLYELKERIYLAVRRIERDLEPGRWGLYKFQEGTGLDPLKPSPLWDKKNNNKPENIKQRGEGR